MATKPILNGSMIQPWLSESWNEEDWREELGYMAAVKMDHIILQWTIDNTPESKNEPIHPPPHAFYPTAISGISPAKKDGVIKLLSAAASKHFQVWLGLVWNLEWETKELPKEEDWLKEQFRLAQRNAEELWNNYKGDFSATIAGFYLPLEVDNERFGSIEGLLAELYLILLNSLRKTGKPLMVAPYFNEHTGQSPVQYAAMWGRILKVAPIQIVALQDGIGAAEFNNGERKPHCTLKTIRNWLRAFKNELDQARTGTKLWSDLETFEEPAKEQRFPTTSERVQEQLEKQSEYVEQFTSFSFNHYFSPKQAPFAKYKKYVDELP